MKDKMPLSTKIKSRKQVLNRLALASIKRNGRSNGNKAILEDARSEEITNLEHLREVISLWTGFPPEAESAYEKRSTLLGGPGTYLLKVVKKSHQADFTPSAANNRRNRRAELNAT